VGTLSQTGSSFVGLVQQDDGSKAILKLAPCERLQRELAWYRDLQSGSLAVYRSDLQRGAALFEYLEPGRKLSEPVAQGRDDQATIEIAKLIRGFSYSSDAKDTFLSVRSFAKDFGALDGKISSDLFAAARKLFEELTQDTSSDVILHGDLHHGNVLLSATTWRAIDPHGYRGPAAFEVAAMIRNPHDAYPGDLKRTVKRRLDILAAELPFDKREINAWCFIGTILSACWSQMDFGTFDHRLIDIASVITKKGQ
jgi:streptomycin 6-kinase